MSRFKNLELEIKRKPEKSESEQNYDEAYYMDLARKAQIYGDFEMALRYFSRALSYKIDQPEAWTNQVLCLIDLGEIDEAIVWADKAAEVVGPDTELYAVKAMAIGRKGDIERALGYSDSVMKKGENKPLVWLSRADIIIASDPRNAEFCFKKAIECNRFDPFTYIRIGITLLSVKDPMAAQTYLKKALELNPRSPFINFLIGKCYQMAGMPDNARMYYEHALKIKPDYQDCIEGYTQVAHQNAVRRFFSWLGNFFKNPWRLNNG